MIYLANDHAGYEMIAYVKTVLDRMGVTYVHVGNKKLESGDNYVTYTRRANALVAKDPENMGIYSCGTGIGTSIAANRDYKIRAALCPSAEFAKLARKHNNANVLVLPGRFMKKATAKKIVKTFLAYQFEAGRHQKRVNMLSKPAK